MSILKVARLGHPILRKVADPLPRGAISSPEIQRLIEDMIETMREHDGVGLAAPQVHVSKPILVLEVQENPRYPQAPQIPLQVLINPRLLSLSPEIVEDWEGCLSLIDFRGRVPRHREVNVQAYDRTGKEIQFTAKNFLARVIQHEYDHLIGKVFLDRMRDFETLSYLAEYQRYWEEA
ncbi:MAG: peptide deformylase [Candidatus Tectomicrobia bacterium]|uniref:Peptide deformylase n=1 Tax=Tectimicrobiota bacterium TaxID=2528274 RepID=A0A932CNW7_UNCTE|nr:peptide deformylase [Candidatus Tectomicrobia bacterium]